MPPKKCSECSNYQFNRTEDDEPWCNVYLFCCDDYDATNCDYYNRELEEANE